MSYGTIGGSAAKVYEAIPQSEARVLQVWGATGSLEYQVEALQQSLKELAVKLQPLLSPTNVSGSAEPQALYSCELAVRVDTQSEKLRQLRVGVDELLHRLEI